MPTASMRNTTVLMIALALGACGGDGSTEGTSNDTSDSDSDSNSNSNSGTVSVTLGTTMSASDSGSESSTVSTTVEPTETTDPTTTDATVNPDTGSSGESDTTGDSSGSESSSTGDDGGATIYEIQMEVIPADTDVEVFGVVVTAVGMNPSRFWAEEPGGGEYSGILVFAGMQGDALGVGDLQIGDVVDITGTVVEYFDLTEIDISAANGTLAVTGSGQDITPDVVDVSVFSTNLTAEPWESTLVRIEGAPLTVTALDPDYPEYTVSDGNDDVIIDDFVYDSRGDMAAFPSFGTGATFDAIQGPVNWFLDEWKVMPRADTDLEGYSAP